VARKLNDLLAGKSAAQIREQRLLAAPVETSIADATAGLIESTEEGGAEPGFLEGLRDLLRQPEFTQGERILGLMELLEERNIQRAIPAGTGAAADVNIIIGREHPIDAMQVCSVITTRYTGPSGLRGTLSVVGPTRMHYPRTVSMVRYMSALMEELLGVYFA
jgi:heat-inducible transcriptional repressor